MDAYDYFSKKIVLMVASTIDAPTVANVAAHLCISLGAHGPKDLMGRPMLADADGARHRGIARYGVIIKVAKPTKLNLLAADAFRSERLFTVGYPTQMLETKHDDELAAALAGARTETLQYLGLLLYGDVADVDGVSRKYSLWKGSASETVEGA